MTSSLQSAEPPLKWAALAGVTAALAMFGAAQGLSSPLFTLLMQKQGLSPALIGLSAAMMPLGLILSASFVPAAVRLVGARTLAVGCSLIGALCFLGIGYLQDWVAGSSFASLSALSSTRFMFLARSGRCRCAAVPPRAGHGRIQHGAGHGYAAGPFALTLIGTSGWGPFAVGAVGFLLCALILRAVSSDLAGFEDDGQSGGGLLGFARMAPALLLAVLVSAARPAKHLCAPAGFRRRLRLG